MNSRTSSAVVPRSTAAKVVGTLGVVAAAGAVAGLGTFGGFSTSDAVDTEVRSGVLSIDLDSAAGATTVPFSSGAMLPGDVEQVPFDLVNDGDVALSSVRFGSVARESSLLDSDRVHGLQMSVQSCSEAWTATGGVYSCGGDLTDFYAGPIVMDTVLAGAHSLAPGGVDHLVATVSFPEDADDRMRQQTSRLTFTFTAAQRDGAAR